MAGKQKNKKRNIDSKNLEASEFRGNSQIIISKKFRGTEMKNTRKGRKSTD